MEVVYHPRGRIFRFPARVIHSRRKTICILVCHRGNRGSPVVPRQYDDSDAKRSIVCLLFSGQVIDYLIESAAFNEMNFQREYLTALQTMSTATFAVCSLALLELNGLTLDRFR